MPTNSSTIPLLVSRNHFSFHIHQKKTLVTGLGSRSLARKGPASSSRVRGCPWETEASRGPTASAPEPFWEGGGGGVCGLNRVYLEAGSCILVRKYLAKSKIINTRASFQINPVPVSGGGGGRELNNLNNLNKLNNVNNLNPGPSPPGPPRTPPGPGTPLPNI